MVTTIERRLLSIVVVISKQATLLTHQTWLSRAGRLGLSLQGAGFRHALSPSQPAQLFARYNGYCSFAWLLLAIVVITALSGASSGAPHFCSRRPIVL